MKPCLRLILGLGLLLWVQSQVSLAANISNPMNLMFAADREESFVDVIDVKSHKSVFRIKTPYRADTIVATPFAPLLFISNSKKHEILAYDLSKKRIDRSIALSITPRHIVMDPSGKYIGITDSQGGGIAIVSTYGRELVYEDDNFPATSDVLFDPNEIDLYYVNNVNGSLGRLDLNTFQTTEIPLVDAANSSLSSPSRSLDGRYIYVADSDSGRVYTINAFSGAIFNAFHVGASPARPFTSPEGLFLYLIDRASGSFVSIEQGRFQEHSSEIFEAEVELITVGRFDRLNLLLSTTNKAFFIYDNATKALLQSGEFKATPLDAQGGIDGERAFVAFSDAPQIAVVDLESQKIQYIKATENGVGAFVVGATNNVCH